MPALGNVTTPVTAFPGMRKVLATYEVRPAKIYRFDPHAVSRAKTLPLGAGPAAVWETSGITVEEVSDGLDHETMAVLNGIGTVMNQPGRKKIRLHGEPGPDGRPPAVIGDTRILLHTHLLETVSQLIDEGPESVFEITIDDGR